MKYSRKSQQLLQTCSLMQISKQTPESRLQWTQKPFQSLTRLKEHLRTRQKRGSQRFQLAFRLKNERMYQLKRLRYWLKARLVDQKSIEQYRLDRARSEERRVGKECRSRW